MIVEVINQKCIKCECDLTPEQATQTIIYGNYEAKLGVCPCCGTTNTIAHIIDKNIYVNTDERYYIYNSYS